MTIQTRAQRVIDAIEGCEAAVDARSAAISAVLARDATLASRFTLAAVEIILEQRPDVLRDVDRRALARYLARQVRILADQRVGGPAELAELELRPLAN